jgi:hypothetical protein
MAIPLSGVAKKDGRAMAYPPILQQDGALVEEKLNSYVGSFTKLSTI